MISPFVSLKMISLTLLFSFVSLLTPNFFFDFFSFFFDFTSVISNFFFSFILYFVVVVVVVVQFTSLFTLSISILYITSENYIKFLTQKLRFKVSKAKIQNENKKRYFFRNEAVISTRMRKQKCNATEKLYW